MKININEWDHVFEFDLTPETVAEAALLVRIGMNTTKEVSYISTNANKDGTITSGIALKKVKRVVSQVSRGKW